MKKFVAVVSVLLFFCVSANAAEDFTTGWVDYLDSGEVTFTPSGTTLAVTASDSGEGSWGEYYTTAVSASLGEAATFNVTSVSGSGTWNNVGLRKYVARNSSGNRILVGVRIASDNGRNSLQYRIRERRGDTSETVQTLARGYFGDSSGTWSTGEDIQLGLWYKDSVVYLSCSKFPGQVTQVRLPQITSAIESEVEIFAGTENSGNIAATISNLNLGTSIAQVNGFSGTSIVDPVVAVQPDLSFTVPSMSYGDLNIWTNFQFAGTVDGKLTWELENWGVNE